MPQVRMGALKRGLNFQDNNEVAFGLSVRAMNPKGV